MECIDWEGFAFATECIEWHLPIIQMYLKALVLSNVRRDKFSSIFFVDCCIASQRLLLAITVIDRSSIAQGMAIYQPRSHWWLRSFPCDWWPRPTKLRLQTCHPWYPVSVTHLARLGLKKLFIVLGPINTMLVHQRECEKQKEILDRALIILQLKRTFWWPFQCSYVKDT